MDKSWKKRHKELGKYRRTDEITREGRIDIRNKTRTGELMEPRNGGRKEGDNGQREGAVNLRTAEGQREGRRCHIMHTLHADVSTCICTVHVDCSQAHRI